MWCETHFINLKKPHTWVEFIKNCSMKRVVKLALLFAFLIPLSSLAQNIQLTGTVTDTTGETVIGASVLEKGTTNGVITNIDGNFSLNVSPKAIIVISYVGYTTQEIPLNGAKNIKVVLREDTEMLEEVVVIGYGTMKKSDRQVPFHLLTSKNYPNVPPLTPPKRCKVKSPV